MWRVLKGIDMLRWREDVTLREGNAEGKAVTDARDTPKVRARR